MSTPAKTATRTAAQVAHGSAGGELVLLPHARDRSERAARAAAEPAVGRPPAHPSPPTPAEATAARGGRRVTASVTLLRDQVFIEVQDAAAVELVDRALLAALFEAGVGAGKDGPHVATAVVPPTCYGKIRVANRDEDALRAHLAAARRAALAVLREYRCLINDRR